MSRRLDLVIAALATVGLAVAGYLTWIHYAGIQPFCTGASNCEQVQTSPYAELGGVPVALLGLVGYTAILGSLALRDEIGSMATALLVYVGVGFSAYLTYLELFRIHAICQWCVISAVVMVALAVLATVRLLRTGPARPDPPAGLGPLRLRRPRRLPRPARWNRARWVRRRPRMPAEDPPGCG